MRIGLFVALVAIVSVLPVGSASAGGIVINFRQMAASAASRGIEPVALPLSNGQDSTGTGEGTTVTQNSVGTALVGGPGGSTPRPPPGFPLPPPLPGGTIDPAAGNSSTNGDGDGGTGTTNGTISARTKYLADESYADLDEQGCGGATAARGPAGLLPLAVAALALLRRRR